MSNRTLSVSLPSDLRRFVAGRVKSGRCRSEDEVVLEALRVWRRLGKRGLDDARQKIAQGLDDARAGRFVDPEATFRRLDRKIARRRRASR